MNYLSISVLTTRNSPDCTNGGISSKTDTLYVASENGNLSLEDIDTDRIMVLKKDICMGSKRLRLIPQTEIDKKSWTMFGGNFGWCTDSRINELFENQPVKIHDRVES